jgi:hypothetical protein
MVKGAICGKSKGKACSLIGWEFTHRRTTMSGRDGLSSSEKSQRSINEDFAIEIENIKLWETGLGSSFITTHFATMFVTDATMPSVRTIS